MAHYTKTYSEPSDLVSLLKSRGMTVDNEAMAQQYLKRIGYYRMPAYFYSLLAMQKEPFSTISDASFALSNKH